ncbi:muscarinic acetylcholine receptor M4-like [Glandiceps talaboti]
MAALLTTIAFVTTVSNLLIIIAFAWNRKLRKLTNYFYVSMAISDFIAGLFDMAPGIWEALMGYENWKFGRITCIAWLVLDYWIYTSSTYTMLVICIDRYFAILHGLRYRRRRTHTLVMTMIISCWVLAFIVEVPGIIFWHFIAGESIVDYSYYCDVEWAENETYAMINTLLTMFIPFAFILILSFAIWIALRRRSRALMGKGGGVSLMAYSVKSHPGSKAKKPDTVKQKLGRLEEETEENQIEENLTRYNMRPENFKHVSVQTDECECTQQKTEKLTFDKSVSTSDLQQFAADVCQLSTVDSYDGDKEGIDNPIFTLEDDVGNDDFGNSPDKRREVSKLVDVHAEGVGFLIEEEPNAEKHGEDNKVNVLETISDSIERKSRDRRELQRTTSSTRGRQWKAMQRKNTAKTVDAGSKSANLNRLAGDRQAVISFAILLGTFIILWTPWFTIAVIESICSDTCVMGDEMYYVAQWLIYLNSMINPYIYVFRDAGFKSTIKAILCCAFCRKENTQKSVSFKK